MASMKHVAIIGAGKVGQVVGYSLLCHPEVEKLSVVDYWPKISEMVVEELRHCSAAYGSNIPIEAVEEPGNEDFDLAIIAAGFPRKPGMDRRDLGKMNAEVMNSILGKFADSVSSWFITTNPVDAITTYVQNKLGKDAIVYGTGTNLETMRLRAYISEKTGVPVTDISGYVGGEHGKSAQILWSTISIQGQSYNDYIQENKESQINDKDISQYVKQISTRVIEALGGTQWGPGGGFTELITAYFNNEEKLRAFSLPYEFEGIPEPVHVTIPAVLNSSIRKRETFTIWDELTEQEKEGIKQSAKEIYETLQI